MAEKKVAIWKTQQGTSTSIRQQSVEMKMLREEIEKLKETHEEEKKNLSEQIEILTLKNEKLEKEKEEQLQKYKKELHQLKTEKENETKKLDEEKAKYKARYKTKLRELKRQLRHAELEKIRKEAELCLQRIHKLAMEEVEDLDTDEGGTSTDEIEKIEADKDITEQQMKTEREQANRVKNRAKYDTERQKFKKDMEEEMEFSKPPTRTLEEELPPDKQTSCKTAKEDLRIESMRVTSDRQFSVIPHWASNTTEQITAEPFCEQEGTQDILKRKPIIGGLQCDVNTLKIYALRTLIMHDLPQPMGFSWGNCPMTMVKNHKRYIATVSHGESKTLQAPGSDFSLHIPAESEGTFIKGVHVDHPIFHDNISNEECIISALTEVHISEDRETKKNLTYTLVMPHCITNRILWQYIKVKIWNRVNKRMEFKELNQRETREGDGDYFVMDEKVITIYTRHFSKVTATICEKASCKRSLRIILLAKMEGRRQNSITTLKFKSFICSRLHSIQEFRNHLLNNQRSLGLIRIEEGDLYINPESINPQNTCATMTLRAAKLEPADWGPCEDDDQYWIKEERLFRKQTTLEEAMDLDPCPCRNINRNDPRAAMVVDMMTEDGYRDHFDGRFDVTIHAVKTVNGKSCSTKSNTYAFERIIFTMPPPEISDKKLEGAAGGADNCNGIKAQVQGRSLTDSHIFRIANKLHKKTDIIKLGLALEMKQEEMDVYITNNSNDITAAAHEVLCKWSKKCASHEQAYCILSQTLVDTEMNSIAKEVLDYPP